MSSSSENSACVNTLGLHGFPEKCVCGRLTVIYTSKSKDNPGRPFFRCPTMRNDHLFKWVEDGVFEEVKDVLPKVECLETEMGKSKVEIQDVKSVLEELMEEMIHTKNEVKRCKQLLKVCFGSLFFIIMILVVFIVYGKSK